MPWGLGRRRRRGCVFQHGAKDIAWGKKLRLEVEILGVTLLVSNSKVYVYLPTKTFPYKYHTSTFNTSRTNYD